MFHIAIWSPLYMSLNMEPLDVGSGVVYLGTMNECVLATIVGPLSTLSGNPMRTVGHSYPPPPPCQWSPSFERRNMAWTIDMGGG